MPEIYRFRRIENLFGKYHELENQSIYFAHPTELNDPMEQSRDIVWKGDEIIWRNLFKHYLYCLDRVFQLTIVAPKGYEIGISSIPIYEIKSDTKTHQQLAMLDEIESRTFGSVKLEALLGTVLTAEREIRRSELVFYLGILRLIALPIIQNTYVDHGLLQESVRVKEHDEPTFEYLETEKLADLIDQEDRDKLDRVFALLENRMLDLLKTENFGDDPHISGQSGLNRRFVMFEFPSAYANLLGKLLNPEWYSACFTRVWDNELMWAHYTDAHKGVCLIFDTVELDGKEGLSLYQLSSFSSSKDPTTGEITHREHWDWGVNHFDEVVYTTKRDPIDFFTHIGALPRKSSIEGWYSDENGNMSVCAAHLADTASVEDWRENLWKKYLRDIIVKTYTWEYERESRIVLVDSLHSLEDPAKRALKYDLASLKGIIFGINTSDCDVKCISNIVERKCTENASSNVTLYRAYHLNSQGRIGRRTIRTIKSPTVSV